MIDLRQESEHPSRWTLSRLVAGDLPADQARALREHTDDCADCQEAIAALQARKHEFALSPVRARVAEVIRAEATRQARPGWLSRLTRPRALGAFGAMAAAAVALIVIVPGLLGEEPTERSKGAGFEFDFKVLQGDQVVPGVSGAPLPPGARIQFRYGAPSGGFLYVVGIDALGKVSRYFPAPGAASAEVGPGRARPLPHSVILDAAPDERVFALLCASPLKTGELNAAIRQMRDGVTNLLRVDSLPLDCVQRTVDLPRRSP